VRVDEAGDEGGFADALGAEDDDFGFERVWRMGGGHFGQKTPRGRGESGIRKEKNAEWLWLLSHI
jgi:hypothetical protein